jgi:hypothetical protein
MTDTINIIIEFDEVLVNTAQICYSKIRNNWEEYEDIFKNVGELSEDKILRRTIRNLDEWLIKDELKDKFYSDIKFRKQLTNSLNKIIYEDGDIYSELMPTNFARKILMGSYIENKKIKNIYIVDKAIDKDDRNKKIKFIKEHFKNDKIKIIIDENEKNIMNIFETINWSIFVTDNLDSIDKLLTNENIDISGREFLVPEKGYNQFISPDKFAVIALQESSLVYYGDTKSSNVKV